MYQSYQLDLDTLLSTLARRQVSGVLTAEVMRGHWRKERGQIEITLYRGRVATSLLTMKTLKLAGEDALRTIKSMGFLTWTCAIEEGTATGGATQRLDALHVPVPVTTSAISEQSTQPIPLAVPVAAGSRPLNTQPLFSVEQQRALVSRTSQPSQPLQLPQTPPYLPALVALQTEVRTACRVVELSKEAIAKLPPDHALAYTYADGQRSLEEIVRAANITVEQLQMIIQDLLNWRLIIMVPLEAI